MKIEIRRLDKGAEAAFPFELKEQFRTAFPSAKWNANRRCWQVGPRSITRLEGWAAKIEASGVLEALAEREAAELDQQEVERLELRLADIVQACKATATEIRTRLAKAETVDALRASIASRDEELRALRQEREAAVATQSAARDALHERIAQLADISDIEALRSGMLSDWSALKAANRSRFDEKQGLLAEIQADLEAAGLRSRALDLAVSANFNRPDRDKPDLYEALEFEEVEAED